MNRGWGPDQRRGSNPWWAFGSLDLAQSTDTMHKSVTDLAQSSSSMRKSVSPHSVSFPNDYRRQSWSALLFCLSVREGGWRGISNRLPLSHITSVSVHFTCLHKKEQVFSFAHKSSQLLFFFSSATSEPFWYLVFSHQNISRICWRSNFGSGICDKGELGDKIGGIHSQTLILPDSMYIWKGIHQGKKIWV